MEKTRSRITEAFSKEDLEYMYSLVYCHEVADNNEKADLLKALIGPDFDEIGTGTNRFCAIKDGYTWKFALDNRGVLDNVSEFYRSQELSEYYCTKTYECNGIIVIAEYVTLMEEDEFKMNIPVIKSMLEDIKENYIFGDLGVITKNFCNYGYRDNFGDSQLVMLDYAYLYPIVGNEDALICPRCGAQLINKSNYDGYICTNTACGTKYKFMDVRRRMNQEIENEEQSYFREKPKRIHQYKDILRFIAEKHREG